MAVGLSSQVYNGDKGILTELVTLRPLPRLDVTFHNLNSLRRRALTAYVIDRLAVVTVATELPERQGPER